MNLGRYLAWECPKCKKWQTTEIRALSAELPESAKLYWLQKKVLKCKYCGKVTRIKHKNKYGLSVNAVFFQTPQKASEFAAKKNGEQRKINKYV